jgi:hypothetical protein
MTRGWSKFESRGFTYFGKFVSKMIRITSDGPVVVRLFGIDYDREDINIDIPAGSRVEINPPSGVRNSYPDDSDCDDEDAALHNGQDDDSCDCLHPRRKIEPKRKDPAAHDTEPTRHQTTSDQEIHMPPVARAADAALAEYFAKRLDREGKEWDP